MVHYIIEAVLGLVIISLTYNYFKLMHRAGQLVQLNQTFIEEYETVYKKIVELEEDLKVARQSRDLYWEDRLSLMETIKSLGRFNDSTDNM